jgi:hypothetical protein
MPHGSGLYCGSIERRLNQPEDYFKTPLVFSFQNDNILADLI